MKSENKGGVLCRIFLEIFLRGRVLEIKILYSLKVLKVEVFVL